MPAKFGNIDLNGLSEQDARKRLERDGANEIPGAKRNSLSGVLFDVVREPMFLLLIACGILYLILGERGEALMLLGFVTVVVAITFYQAEKTERALSALRDLSSPRALVIRDRMQKRIPGREVVTGDVLLIAEGDRIPADAVLLSGSGLSVDESLLTGESVPVRKTPVPDPDAAQSLTMEPPGGDDRPFLFSGTMVVRGQGIALARGTGMATELGKIGKALQTLEPESTLLQKETGKLVRNFAMMGLLLCLMVVVAYGLTRNDWLKGLLAGLTLAMATLPEEFPVVLTVFLALGAWRISQRRVLTRRVPAVEMLGAATVLCVDKTGTLTQNRMTVTSLLANDTLLTLDEEPRSLPEDFHSLVEYGILATPLNPFDPMEKAIRQLGEQALINTEHLHSDWSLVREYPLSDRLLAMSHVWRSTSGPTYVIAAKGAPEAIADLCHFNTQQMQALTQGISRMAELGLRVIAVARAEFLPPPANGALPAEQHDFDFQFAGLLGLADPIRPEVPPAVQECYGAGLRIIMITGDYPGTARSIAGKIGLSVSNDIVTGHELDLMTDAQLREAIKTTTIFARAVPEQKLRIVTALKANGEVVAMTGDGVNDSPALKAAHIGIAMGGRGTDVARESAALVLLDDDFASIVAAVKLGRRIFDNLKKAMAFIFSVHLPIAGMSLIPVLVGWPLALLPVHVLFLELIIDPACSIVFEMEAEEADIMRRPPRPLHSLMFGRSALIAGLIQGLGLLGITVGAYAFGLAGGSGESEARMLAFVSLVIGNLGLIFSNRSRTQSILATLGSRNPALWWIAGGTILSLVAVLTVPILRTIFRFGPVQMQQLPLLLLIGALSIVLIESTKLKWLRDRLKR